jgi:hypothetical protein
MRSTTSCQPRVSLNFIMINSNGQGGGSWNRDGSAANHHRQDNGRGSCLPIPRRNEFNSQRKAGRQESGRDGPRHHDERDPARMGGGRNFAANNRSLLERKGFSGTAQQQLESPFPAGQQQYPNPGLNEFTKKKKAGRQKSDRGGPWPPGDRMEGGGGVAASKRCQDGVWGTAQQQPESAFPVGQNQCSTPRPQGHDFSKQQKAGPNQMEEDADYRWHPKSSEQKKHLQHLLAIKSPEDRKNEFKKLSPEKSLSLVLDMYALPPQDVPLNWDEDQEKATVVTAEWIKKESGLFGKHALEEEDSDAGSSSDGMYGMRNRCKPELPYLEFSKTLRYCYPMTSGFHDKDWNGACCYCPCGKNLANWRKIFGVQDFLEETDRYGANKLCNLVQKRPRELLQHVKTKKEGCKAHAIVWHFLNEVFANYYEKGIRHIAFANMNSEEYDRAKAAIQRKAKT